MKIYKALIRMLIERDPLVAKAVESAHGYRLQNGVLRLPGTLDQHFRQNLDGFGTHSPSGSNRHVHSGCAGIDVKAVVHMGPGYPPADGSRDIG